LNAGLREFTRKVDEAKAEKAKWQQVRQRLANEQAEKVQRMEAEEKAKREWQEQLAELAWVNWEVSPSYFSKFSF